MKEEPYKLHLDFTKKHKRGMQYSFLVPIELKNFVKALKKQTKMPEATIVRELISKFLREKSNLREIREMDSLVPSYKGADLSVTISPNVHKSIEYISEQIEVGSKSEVFRRIIYYYYLRAVKRRQTNVKEN